MTFYEWGECPEIVDFFGKFWVYWNTSIYTIILGKIKIWLGGAKKYFG
jgi:hypothetical protein